MLQIPRKKGHRQLFYSLIGLIAIVIVVGLFLLIKNIKKTVDDRPTHEERVEQKIQKQVAEEKQKKIESGQPLFGTIVSGQKYIQFTGEEFKNFYTNYHYEHVQTGTLPTITGNVEADNHIRTIAESRGYRLRPVAEEQFLKTIKGQRIQGKIVDDLSQLQAAGKEATGIEFIFASGYRPVERQRELFLAKLTDVSHEDIIAGKADAKINEILITRSIPGYSKHHSGYTIDIGCGNYLLEYAFADGACFSWLSANNYENAKQFGFIPSYPEGSGNQGPDPEPWEYVWVGEDVLLAAPYQQQ